LFPKTIIIIEKAHMAKKTKMKKKERHQKQQQ